MRGPNLTRVNSPELYVSTGRIGQLSDVHQPARAPSHPRALSQMEANVGKCPRRGAVGEQLSLPIILGVSPQRPPAVPCTAGIGQQQVKTFEVGQGKLILQVTVKGQCAMLICVYLEQRDETPAPDSPHVTPFDGGPGHQRNSCI